MSEEIKIDVSKKVKKEVCKEVKEVKKKLSIKIPSKKICKFDGYYIKEKPELKHHEYTIYN